MKLYECIDYAKQERAELIAATQDWKKQAEFLATRVIQLQTALERAIYWLDNHAPGRAREELLEATRQ